MRVLSRTWQMLLKGIAEVKEAARPVAAAEMVLVRIAYAADLPSPDDIIRSLGDASQRPAASPGRPPLPNPPPLTREARVGAGPLAAKPPRSRGPGERGEAGPGAQGPHPTAWQAQEQP